MKGHLRIAIRRRAAKMRYEQKQKEQEDYSSDESSDLSTDDSEFEDNNGIIGCLYYHNDKNTENPYNNYYLPLKYLGKGTFSKVWLVYDILNVKYYAMKVQNPRYYEDAKEEIRVMKDLTKETTIKGGECVMKMYDNFTFYNEYEKKEKCMIYDLLGCDLTKILHKYRHSNVPIKLIKIIARDMLLGLQYSADKNIIHTDIKPENILIEELPTKVKDSIEKFKKLERVTQGRKHFLASYLPIRFSRSDPLSQIRFSRFSHRPFCVQHIPRKAF